MSKHRLINALLRKPVDRTPVWIMRQAGRYLPEYRKTRAQAKSFLALCKNPELATEVTMQPLRRYPQLDAAIVFSDILTIPDAMGLGLQFVENEGPSFSKPINHPSDIQALPKLNIGKDLHYVLATVQQVRQQLENRLPLIGFSGSPWTLATYMVEGRSKTNFDKIKSMLYQNPKHLHSLLQKLSEAIIDYLNEQIAHGAQVIQIFDTWGGILSTQAYYDFSLYYMDQIINNLNREQGGEKIPIILFTKNGGQWLEAIAETSTDAISIDWTTDIAQAKKRVGHKVALQGNLDPHILAADSTVIRQNCQQIIENYQAIGEKNGHVFNLGHGITPNIEPQKVEELLNAVVHYGKQ